MAEALGIVASGIAVAQVAGTAANAVIRLKRLWGEVKDVPENIADLMEQIDCLDPALWEAEQHFIQNQLPPQLWDDTAAIRSAKYCRKALQKLTDVADDLSSQINSGRRVDRRISCIKVLLKKDKLRDLERRLESALRMLQLAQQGYLITLVKLQPDIIACKVTSQLETIQRPNSLITDDKETEHRNNSAHPKSFGAEAACCSRRELRAWKKPSIFGRVNISSTPDGFIIHTQPPWWLTGMLSAWSLNIAKSYSGWKFHLRNYPIRSAYSMVFDVVQRDDVKELQAMFDAGEASPFDRTEIGSSILHYAVFMASVKVTRLLKDMKLDVDCPNIGGFIATDCAYWCPRERIPNRDRQLEFTQLLSPDCFIFKDIEDCRYYSRCPAVSDVEVFRRLQPIICPAHNETPLITRLRRAALNMINVPPLKLEIVRRILSPDSNEDLKEACNSDANPRPIHVIALATSQFDISLKKFDNWRGTEIEGWINYARNVIQRSDLHDLSCTLYHPTTSGNMPGDPSSRLTPLLCILLWPLGGHFRFPYRKSQVEHSGQTRLQNWLSLLKVIGIDLIKYGREELRILRASDPKSRTIMMYHYTHTYHITEMGLVLYADLWEGHYTLISFRFGPNVDDWNIFWSEPTDEFAGEFWDMVENPIPRIPGSWYEADAE
ncbi:hypothetical protein F4805DRAFT_413339 [Annulohypoxylon moriforme]|nr:hypothetical protein F4805DRAFT_413339 [Annulohypoxylon moriforme]